MTQRLRPLIISVLFLLVSLGAYQLTDRFFQVETPTAVSCSNDTPAGVWKQYVVDEGTPIYLATFRFEQQGDDFQVHALEVAPVTFPQSDFRTFGHRYDGKRWGFHSDWHQYGVAWFELEKKCTDRFEGYAYLDGKQRPNRHILIRVAE